MLPLAVSIGNRRIKPGFALSGGRRGLHLFSPCVDNYMCSIKVEVNASKGIHTDCFYPCSKKMVTYSTDLLKTYKI